MSPRTLIVADDLTGAQDTAIQLKHLGSRVEVALSMDYLHANWINADIWAIDTETRFLSPIEAFGKVQECLRHLNEHEYFLYKKVDSTLRGNIGAEIEATLRAARTSVAIVASALPNSGRTIVGGQALVHGVPLHETECGRDPFTPVATSDVCALIATQTTVTVGRIDLDTVRAGAPALRAALERGRGRPDAPTILVCDCETETDLASIAALRDARDVLFVGSSGLASAFFGATIFSAVAHPVDGGPPFLFVVGSLNSVSHEQADRVAATRNSVVITVDPQLAAFAPEAARRHAAADLDAVADLDRRHILLRCGREPVLTDTVDALEIGRRIAVCLALIGRDTLARSPARRVFMTGGEMAARVLKTVAAEGIRLVAEAEPGVPYGDIVGGDLDGYRLFSKAGGFGDADILVKLTDKGDA